MCGSVWVHKKGKISLQIAIGFVSVWVWHVITSHMRDVDSQAVSVLQMKIEGRPIQKNNSGPELQN